MSSKKPCKVFVSYSRHDEALAKPLAGLLGVAADEAVFLDIDSLKPGDSWEAEIEHAIRASAVFVLCWCCESSRSEFIKKEINIALEDAEKLLVPVLLCATPLPSPLKERQWINLQGRVMHVCDGHEFVIAPTTTRSDGKGADTRSPLPSTRVKGRTAPKSSAIRLWWVVTVILVCFLAAFSVFRGAGWLRLHEVVCEFREGPRTGKLGIVASGAEARPGDLCTDGKGSRGIIVDTTYPEPQTFLLFGFGLLALPLIQRLQKLHRRREASSIADRVVAYFEQL